MKEQKSIAYLLGILSVIATVCLLLISSINKTNVAISDAESERYGLFKLVDELRQSSDDLTRMARLVVVTGDSAYLDYYQEILDIRNGTVPRPTDYSDVYWDLYLSTGNPPRPDLKKIALLDTLAAFNVAAEDFLPFRQAKERSDDLAVIELDAMHLSVGKYLDENGSYNDAGKPDREKSIAMLHSPEYHKIKAEIMSHIQDFNNQVEEFSLNEIVELKQTNSLSNKILLTLIGLATLLMIITIGILLVAKSERVDRTDETNEMQVYVGLKDVISFWPMVTITLVLITGLFIFLNITRDNLREKSEDSILATLSTVHSTTTNSIVSWLEDVESELYAFKNSKEFNELTVTAIEQTAGQDFENSSLRGFISSFIHDNSYEGFVLFNTQKDVVNSYFKSGEIGISLNKLNEASCQKVLGGELPLVIEVPEKNNDESDQFNQFIRAGIPVVRNDEIIGGLVIIYNPRQKLSENLQRGRIGESGESYAFNNYGQMISESRFNDQLEEMNFIEPGESSILNIELRDPMENLTLKPEAAQNLGKNLPLTFMASQAIKGNSGHNINGYNDYRGVKVIGVWSWMEKYGFGASTEIDFEEAYESFRSFSRILTIGVFITILLLVLLTFLSVLNGIRSIRKNRLVEVSLNKVKKSQEFLQNTIESLSHPFYVVDATTYEIVLANSAAKKHAVNGISTCHALTHRRYKPCDSKEDPCPLEIVRKTGKPAVVEHIHYDENNNEIYAEVHGYPIFNEDGEVVQMIEYSLDISTRKKMEQNLRSSENKFRSITSTASDAIISTDKDGLIESWNAAAERIFGYPEDEILKKPLEIIIPERHHDGHNEGLQRVVEGGEKRVIGKLVELEGKRKNGKIFPMEMSLSDWQGDNGINFSAIIRDITERKKLERALKKANERMKGELAIGREIQMSMVPLIFPAFPQHSEFNINAVLQPAREVGGDFYDFYFLDDKHFCFMVGDVSDKGVASALMMAVCKTLIKSRAIDDSSPGSIITRVNEEISSDNPSSMFITLFIAVLDIETGELTVTNAGHNPPYIKRADGSLERLDKIHGPAIGAMEGIEYREGTHFLKPDDMVLLFTDGVTDATSEEEEMYLEPRIVDFLKKTDINNSKLCVEGLLEEITVFQGKHDQADDITILAVDFIKAQEGMTKEVLDLRIPNKLEEIASVQDKFEAYAEKVELDFGVTMKVNLVLDELLNNVISYAYSDKQVHEIIILFECFESKLKLRIEDGGKEFNPLLLAPPDTEASVEDRKIGGLGIHLVKNVMDEVYYQRVNNKNIMTMVKFI